MRAPFPAPILAALAVAAAPAAAQEGKAAFDQRCARCHSIPEAVAFLKPYPDAAKRGAWLEQKLSRHHARDAKERAAIIRFLEEAYAATAK